MTKKPPVIWKGIGPQTTARILKVLKPRLDAAAVVVQESIVNSFGSPPPQPYKTKAGFRQNSTREWKRSHHSAKGDPPYIQTGHLKRSIGWDVPQGMPHVRRIGSGIGSGKENPGYAFFLEFGTIYMYARPFIRPGLARVREQVAGILRNGAK